MKKKNFALIGAAGYIAPRHMNAIALFSLVSYLSLVTIISLYLKIALTPSGI